MPRRPARDAAKTASEKPPESAEKPPESAATTPSVDASPRTSAQSAARTPASNRPSGKAARAAAGRAGGQRRGTVKLVVDGETFLVRRRPGARGIYDFDWISGRNPDYGFTTALHGASGLSEDQLREEIREFLEQIDPETGYLPD
ncbi:hypothetical protein MTQ01_04710 [Streptomyces sp. XM4193]|uniref:hypothetical protein n=1 Tax=Streptomyces sp. XM4193 TaxID=2929782 RepID=UPI001FF9B174|nr:hypothetical protein [Streptomyces sp. XM4193]MCK1795321.1 hypothetical protein [Streptomyces sp. XM4193]